MYKTILYRLLAVALCVIGLNAKSATLSEGFEKSVTNGYKDATVTGDACTWNLSDAGVFSDSSNSYEGSRALRLGNTAASYANMASDKTGGAAEISFYGRTWSTNDKTAVIDVQYSTDGGSTWITAGTASLSTTTYTKYSYTVNKTGNVRIQFKQTSGKRALIDKVSITDYTASSSSATFTSPANGSTVDFGTCSANKTVQQSVVVKGSGFTDATAVSVSGTGFTVNATTLSASKVNSTSGATVIVNFKGANGGTYTGTLTLTNGSKTVKVTLKATVSGSTTVTGGSFTSPTNGSTVNFGTVNANTSSQQSVNVKGSGFTSATAVSVSGTGFTANTTSLSAAKVNSTSGATVQVNFKGAYGGTYTGTLTLTNGSTTVKVTLKATVSGSSSGGTTTSATYTSPASGSTVDFGNVTVNKTQTSTVVVTGTNLTGATTVTVTGTGFSSGASTLSAAKVNSATGAQLQINFKSTATGTFNGTLKLTSGSLTRTVALKANAVSDSNTSSSGSSDGSSTGGSTGSGVTSGNIPSGYYSTCENKYGSALLSALCSKISSHTAVSYSGLWTAFKDTDTKSNGKIWDMYSTKEFTYSTNQCGTYTKIGECYNREHSFPKSWFNDATPMYTDLFHVYPTDGFVNNQRANYPFGECSNGTYVASSGNVKPLGKLGKSTLSGYTGTVWEPDDEYKGDFARTYFYMVTAYNTKIKSWSSEMLDGTTYPGFTTWAVNMLLNWNALDPVSQKEVDRNEAVYAKQKNRNPFIDHPELADYIWGSKKTTAWTEGSASATATFSYPADGSTLSFGTTATGSTNEKIIKVKGTGLTGNITATIEGEGFESAEVINSATASQSSLGYTLKSETPTADDADTGIHVRIIFNPTTAAEYTGKLTLKSDNAVSKVTLTSKALDGLPAAPAESVTATSFTARWVEVGDAFDDGTYRLDVADENGPVNGFPIYVNAEDLTYEVTNLSPETKYTYSLTSQTTQSNIIDVTTAALEPSIFFVFDPSEMEMTTESQTPSAVTEILLEGENLTDDITFTVTAPFEVSVNGSDWANTVTAAKDTETVYVRLGAASAGEYVTSLRATSGDYFTDVVTIQGIVTGGSFLEDFEKTQSGVDNYTDKVYEGSACQWNLHDAGIWKGDATHSGNYSLRFGKTAESSIEMVSFKSNGMTSVSFYARKWSANDADATIEVQYATAAGEWTTIGTANITTEDFTNISMNKNVASPVKIRLKQTSGARMLIDNIEVATSTTSISAESTETAKVTLISGGIKVTTNETTTVSVYGLDGIIYVNNKTVCGTEDIMLPATGVYIIAIGNNSYRMVIK